MTGEENILNSPIDLGLHDEEMNEDNEYLTASGNNNQSVNMNNHSNNSEVSDKNSRVQIRQYKIRFFLLIMFISLSMSNAFQWIEYAIIESSITSFYHVTTFWVNCTSVVYMACYIIGIIPATWLLDNYGLRPCLIIASLGNAAGSWIKCLSVNPSLFWVSMIGQTVVAASQLFILNIPPLLAATWFSAEDVTKATAYGVFGNQVGIALGFLIPPILMPGPLKAHSNGTNYSIETTTIMATTTSGSPDEEFDIDGTAQGLRILFYGVSIITSIIFLLIVALFENKPKCPPSEAQAYAQTMNGEQSFSSSIKALMTNINFLFLLVSYGLNTGVFYAISTVLAQMVTNAIGNGYAQEAGIMGLTITLTGIVGSIVCGYVLGYTKKFKGVTLFVYVFSLIGTVAFTAGLQLKSIMLLYAMSGLLGFFMTGYLPIGFEFAAEISFPQPEGTSAGLLNASAQVFGIIFTFGSSWVIDAFGQFYANVFFIVALIIGVILTVLVKNDLRRQKAQLRPLSEST
ncbi:hypothetical protein BLOT_000451 [Blomia tropicalis]|nr:hypothetical protein BLOT_000451 [Blomia tropicalis]